MALDEHSYYILHWDWWYNSCYQFGAHNDIISTNDTAGLPCMSLLLQSSCSAWFTHRLYPDGTDSRQLLERQLGSLHRSIETKTCGRLVLSTACAAPLA
jgi:hypothetical protein